MYCTACGNVSHSPRVGLLGLQSTSVDSGSPSLCGQKKLDVMSSEYQNTYLSYVDAMLN